MRLSISDFQNLKGPRVCLTAYTAPMASLIDGVADLILVGDSVGMVLYGFPSTLPVTLDMMALHGQAVVNHTKKSLVVVDLPFGSYQLSPQQAFESASFLLQQTGCTAVKLEGGAVMAETVSFLVQRGIPVMGHIGLQPQAFHQLGGYKVQGRGGGDALIEDARVLEEAGAFAVVLEGIVEPISRQISGILRIPTIGIGASPACGGQILVTDDLLGLTLSPPKFVKTYDVLRDRMVAAVQSFRDDVHKGKFPHLTDHCYQ